MELTLDDIVKYLAEMSAKINDNQEEILKKLDLIEQLLLYRER